MFSETISNDSIPNSVIKLHLLVTQLQSILTVKFEKNKESKNWWLHTKEKYDVKDVYFFTIQKLGICESAKYQYVLTKKIFGNHLYGNATNGLVRNNNTHNNSNDCTTNSFTSMCKNKKQKAILNQMNPVSLQQHNKLFGDRYTGYFDKQEIQQQTIQCSLPTQIDQQNNFTSENIHFETIDLLHIEEYLKKNKLRYGLINIEKKTIPFIENYDGVKKLVHVDEICYDFYPCKHAAKIEDINGNVISVNFCSRNHIKALMEKQNITHKKMVEHFYESYEDFFECKSDTSFSDIIIPDPFDNDIDEFDNLESSNLESSNKKNKQNSFHLVELSKSTNHVSNVLVWSDKIDSFKIACFNYLMKFIPKDDYEEIEPKLIQLIEAAIIQSTMRNKNDSNQHENIDLIDELGYTVSKSYEIRFRNKKLTAKTITV